MIHATTTAFSITTGETQSITGICMDTYLDMMTPVLNGMAGIVSSLMDRVLRCLSGVSVICHVEVIVLCGLMALILSWKMELLLATSTALLMTSAIPTDLTQSKSKLVLEIIMSTNLPDQLFQSQLLYIVQVYSFIFISDMLVMNCIGLYSYY